MQAAVVAELRLRKLQHLLTLLRLAGDAAAAPAAATQPQQPLQQPLRLLVLQASRRRCCWRLVAVELQESPAASAAAAESCKQLRLCCWVRQACHLHEQHQQGQPRT